MTSEDNPQGQAVDERDGVGNGDDVPIETRGGLVGGEGHKVEVGAHIDLDGVFGLADTVELQLLELATGGNGVGRDADTPFGSCLGTFSP